LFRTVISGYSEVSAIVANFPANLKHRRRGIGCEVTGAVDEKVQR
jgi:hypothetical protein